MHRDAQFRHLMDTVPVLIWCADVDRNWVYFNKVWLDFTGRTLEQEVGSGWVSGVHPEDNPRRAALFDEHFERRQPFRAEFRLRRRDGAWRWMLGTGKPRTDLAGRFAGFIGSCNDITEMKEAEAQRQHDLDEKAALLQELHHRVKNNAQVFASLLGVQASRAGDPSVQAALRIAAARASTMAIAQQQIWEAGSSARFDLGALVRRLVQSLKPGQIAVEVDAPDPVLVPLATAVPLGLILHELLTNALRHGFPDGGPGQVGVALRRDGDARLCIAVSDNGAGLPERPSDKTGRSAGLTIVGSLARQLGAVLSTETGRGTRVHVNLPCPQPL
jgi:PAS domain S-box-containing protein